MSTIAPKAPRLQLVPISYQALRQQVLRRDCWRCQSCGTTSNLEVHHKEFRSYGGEDSRADSHHALCLVSRQRSWDVEKRRRHRRVPPSTGLGGNRTMTMEPCRRSLVRIRVEEAARSLRGGSPAGFALLRQPFQRLVI